MGAVSFEAGALQGEKSQRARTLDHRAHEPRLADPRLAGDEQRAAVPVARALERMPPRGKRCVATDEDRTDDTLLDEHEESFRAVMRSEIYGCTPIDRTPTFAYSSFGSNCTPSFTTITVFRTSLMFTLGSPSTSTASATFPTAIDPRSFS